VSDDIDLKNKFKVLSKEEIDEILQEQEIVDELTEEEINLEQDTDVKQLMHFRNLKVYLNKMVGRQWLLLYMREEDGVPIFVPNEHLNPESQVFLSELAKNIIFQMISFRGYED